MEILLFTDLDGSLLNLADYGYDAARPTLARIKESGIPLIFVTSKTRGEVERLHKKMGLCEPFIVENGGAIFFPTGYRGWRIEGGRTIAGYTAIELGVPYARIRRFIDRFGEHFGISGFGDWTSAEIAARCGMSEAEARLAGAREYTEPFQLRAGADLASLETLARGHGLAVTKGGRFYHLIGTGQDKGAAVRITREVAAENLGTRPRAIGIGDSENDLAMLAEVDIPVVIPRPDGTSLDPHLPRVIRAGQPGCAGWSTVVEEILNGFA